jgi:hypothetical protein
MTALLLIFIMMFTFQEIGRNSGGNMVLLLMLSFFCFQFALGCLVEVFCCNVELIPVIFVKIIDAWYSSTYMSLSEALNNECIHTEGWFAQLSAMWTVCLIVIFFVAQIAVRPVRNEKYWSNAIRSLAEQAGTIILIVI